MDTYFVISVVDQNDKTADEELKKKILEARDKMCDIVNGEDGMINRWWNPMLDAVGITDKELRMDTDDVAYTAVTNAIWTAQLMALGVDGVRIVDEHLIMPSFFEKLLGFPGVIKIRIERK